MNNFFHFFYKHKPNVEPFSGWKILHGHYFGQNLLKMTYQAYSNVAKKLSFLDLSLKRIVRGLTKYLNFS